MIKEVEELRPELDTHPLVDRRRLEHREVEIDNALLPKSGIDASFVAEGPWVVLIACRVKSARSCEAGCVEPFADSVDGATGYVLVASLNDVGPEGTDSQARAGECVGTAPADLHREATLEGSNTVKSPTGDNRVGKAVHAGQELLAVSKGQIKRIAEDQTLWNVL